VALFLEPIHHTQKPRLLQKWRGISMVRYKSLIALNFSVFLLMLGVGMIVALLPQRIIDLSGSVSAVGYLTSVFAISYILLQVPIGRLSDRTGFKVFLALGYVVCGLAGLLYYWAETSTLIFLGRLLQGAGEAPIWAMAPALLSLQYPNAKGKVMGIYNASMHLGLTAGPLLGILLAQVGHDNVPFLFFTAASLAASLITYLLLVESPCPGGTVKKTERLNYRNALALVADRKSLVVLIGIMLYGAGYGLFVTIIPAFLISVKDFGQASVGIVFSLFYTAISVSQLTVGPLSDRRGRKGFTVYGLIMAAGGLALFPSFQQPWISVPLTVASLGLGVFYVSSMAYLNDCAPEFLKGTISGAYYVVWGLGYFLGPLIAGRLGDSIGFNVGLYALSGLFVAEAVVLVATLTPQTADLY
jgi:MFS family permease